MGPVARVDDSALVAPALLQRHLLRTIHRPGGDARLLSQLGSDQPLDALRIGESRLRGGAGADLAAAADQRCARDEERDGEGFQAATFDAGESSIPRPSLSAAVGRH